MISMMLAAASPSAIACFWFMLAALFGEDLPLGPLINYRRYRLLDQREWRAPGSAPVW
jgi:hypothetical protein